MACAVLHNIAIERHEPEPEEDKVDFVELEDGEEHFKAAERDGAGGVCSGTQASDFSVYIARSRQLRST
jgi:hypothetical protein